MANKFPPYDTDVTERGGKLTVWWRNWLSSFVQLVTSVENALAVALEALGIANSAQEAADAAIVIGSNAQDAAESAQVTADNALNTANSAQNTANDALEIAEEALAASIGCTLVALEDIDAFSLVSIVESAGTEGCVKASYDTYPARGYTIDGAPETGLVTVYFDGEFQYPAPSTAGKVYLGSAGAASYSVATGTGNIAQIVGYVTQANSIVFRPSVPITLA